MAERESQIATTIEQSNRLLDAGFDPNSCDMEWINVDVWDSEEKKMVGKWVLNSSPCLLSSHPKYVPAWSLSKLWDMLGLDILGGWFSVGSSRSEDVIEELVRLHENRYADH